MGTPPYDGNKWAYITKKFEESKISEMVFPNENYDFDALKKEYFFVGSYNECRKRVGLGIYRRESLKYLYLDDLKVYKDYLSRTRNRRAIAG